MERINDSTEPEAPPDELFALKAELARLRAQLAANPSTETISFDDQKILQDIGIYRYHHPLENAAGYRAELERIEIEVAKVVREQEAIEVSSTFTFENSLAAGRKLSNDLGKLMLRAYNAECDNCIRSLRTGNAEVAKKRIEASRQAIAKLGKIMEMQISARYHDLRVREIELTADWLMKKQEEKEAERENRARLREEKRVEREFAEERERLAKEKQHLENAIEALREKGERNPDLEANLLALEEAIKQNEYRLANIRSGYVYVISNRGAFGTNVVKIGLTRRLEPNDRISELGGASVPFRFDVHALFFSEDAVSLENELHNHFRDRALNAVNARKEFFFATPAEVRDVLMDKVGSLLEFSEVGEALEFHQSRKYWPERPEELK
ncbi:Chromosome segregation ATPase [Rhodobacter sp. AKP1]|nr:Chromosome segregation ATPase [Rhodobacter sp. AKP1]